jgi:hypothetical protein
MSPRLKLGLIVALFAMPIAASVIVYKFFPPESTANYGELLLPPAPVPAGLAGFPRGRWAVIVADSAECAAACAAKLATIRQLRLAMGREAGRVERVFVVVDGRAPDARAMEPFAGTVVVMAPPGTPAPPGPSNDRAHIYVADPLGNVMMRWPAQPDPRRMIRDLERLLKASQIG